MTDAATTTGAKLLSWQIGDVTITRLPECSIAIAGSDFLPDATPEGLARHPWLVPNFATEDGRVYLSFHALAVEAPGMKLIVDTCFGEGKAGVFRPGKDDRTFTFAPITAGRESEGRRVVDSGLKVGDRVVVLGELDRRWEAIIRRVLAKVPVGAPAVERLSLDTLPFTAR